MFTCGPLDLLFFFQEPLEFGIGLFHEWGRLFENWGKVQADAEGKGFPDVGEAGANLIRSGLKHYLEGLRLIGMAVMESPEVQARNRRK